MWKDIVYDVFENEDLWNLFELEDKELEEEEGELIIINS